jgi:von Willebrand factor type A domain
VNSAPFIAELVFDPIVPGPLVILLGLGLLVLTVLAYVKVGGIIERWRNLVLMSFRVAGIALVVLLLLRPSRRELLPPPVRERVTLVAVDTSLSMKQRDMERASRLDAAKNLLTDSGILNGSGVPANSRLRLFQFSDDAQPVSTSIFDLAPAGKTTRLHKSLMTMLNAPAAGEAANALVLLSDGHDFELENPAKTGAAARARQTPIYALAFGKQGKVRDVSVRISNFQPYCYVKQQARVTASLRLIGCEFEDLSVQLLRQGQMVQSRRVNAGEAQEQPVAFEVTEPETGQYEYEIRVQPLENETDTANNSAITYLNVIDQQIRLLMLEGDPYWDTTFLQRSLMRNDKFDVDVLSRYGTDRVRAVRKLPGTGELKVPGTLDQFAAYDVVVLGRAVDRLLDGSQIALLNQYVKDRNGTAIFARGRAFEETAGADELEPVIWEDKPREHTRFEASTEGRGLSALRTLSDGQSGLDWLPDLINARSATEVRPLTATLAVAADKDGGATSPAIVHRRYGRGQVVSVGVAGLWRWALNAKAEGPNTPFDRYWDQMILWLLAGRDFIPTRQFSFRPNSANILLGEKAYFRMTMRQPDPKVKTVPLTLFYGDKEIGRANMTAQSAGDTRLSAEFLPERTGRYLARAKFPDGTTQESRFIVFTENPEETEVATDVLCLRRLCESSGGRLLTPEELPRLLKELNNEKADTTPTTRLRPVWNVAWVFYTVGLLFGLDWFLRRRWGLC